MPRMPRASQFSLTMLTTMGVTNTANARFTRRATPIHESLLVVLAVARATKEHMIALANATKATAIRVRRRKRDTKSRMLFIGLSHVPLVSLHPTLSYCHTKRKRAGARARPAQPLPFCERRGGDHSVGA